jgi:peptidoglycan/xylan/chitin deacetylase (PgdA/CDA1 family)
VKRLRPLAPSIKLSVGLHAAAPFAWLAAPATLPWLAGGLLLDHAILAAAGMWPRSRLLGPNLRGLPPPAQARGEIALTFDDGPDPDVTPRVLDLLDRHEAKASFFCIGTQARAYPSLLRDIVARGHSVENHTDTHASAFACFPPARLRREICRAQTSLADIAGTPSAFFRAPMGLRSPMLDPVLAETSLTYVSWTRRALDGVRGNPVAASRRLTMGLRAGDVLLMHDGRCARPPAGDPVVLEVLPGLLRAIEAAGLRSVSLPAACAGAAWSVDAAPARSASGVYA